MAIYVIQARGTDRPALERASAVREGFSVGALVFAQLWLLVHRLWLALAVWVVAEVAFFLLVAPAVPVWTTVLVDLLAHLYIGFEGNRLRIAVAARGATLTAVAQGRDASEAEARVFAELPAAIAPPL